MVEPAPPLPPPESAGERRRRSAVPAAAWVAIVGGALVLVAAGILVVSTWDTLGRGIRFAGLVLATGGLLFASERLRRLVPTSADVIAHVGTFLTAAIGIAGMSLFEFTWPTCLLAGGALAAVASEYQARRWRSTTLHLGQVIAISLAATGLGEITGTTGGLIGALMALALLAYGAERRAAGLATVAVLSPALTALADAGIGAGTFARAGLIGERLSWSGPIVGVVAAMVLGIVALRRRNNGLMLAAVASPIVGAVTGLAAIDGPAVAWWCLPGLAVIAAELGWWMMPSDRLRRQIATGIDAVAAAVAVGAWIAPLLVAVAAWNDVGRAAALPAVVTGFAVALATLRWHRDDRRLVDVGIAAVAAAVVAVLLALQVAAIPVAAVAIAATGVAGFLSRRLHPIAVYVPAAWALFTVTVSDGAGRAGDIVASVTLLAVLTAVVLSWRARRAADNHWMGWIEMAVVTLAATGAATELVDRWPATVSLISTAVAAAGVMVLDRRFVAWGGVLLAIVGVGTLDTIAAARALPDGYWLGWVATSGAFAVAGTVHRSRLASSLAAAAAVAALAAAAGTLPLTAEEFIGLTMVAGVVLTGATLTIGRRTELDAASWTAGAVLLISPWLDVHPSWVSASIVVVGGQLAIAGLLHRTRWVTASGALVATGGIVSWWFTSGLHEWFVELLEPADIRVIDVWLAVTTALALLGGVAARRAAPTPTWLAYSPMLVVASLWLLPVQIERDTEWALPLTLAIALGSVAAGAWRRLAAPLVGGTALTVATTFVATGSDLRAIPTWAWFAVGGAALLGTAVLIERTGKQGTSLGDLVRRWE